jgi:hypothetical protein
MSYSYSYQPVSNNTEVQLLNQQQQKRFTECKQNCIIPILPSRLLNQPICYPVNPPPMHHPLENPVWHTCGWTTIELPRSHSPWTMYVMSQNWLVRGNNTWGVIPSRLYSQLPAKTHQLLDITSSSGCWEIGGFLLTFLPIFTGHFVSACGWKYHSIHVLSRLWM